MPLPTSGILTAALGETAVFPSRARFRLAFRAPVPQDPVRALEAMPRAPAVQKFPGMEVGGWS